MHSVANTYAEARTTMDEETKSLARYWEGNASEAFVRYAQSARNDPTSAPADTTPCPFPHRPSAPTPGPTEAHGSRIPAGPTPDIAGAEVTWQLHATAAAAPVHIGSRTAPPQVRAGSRGGDREHPGGRRPWWPAPKGHDLNRLTQV